MTFDRIISECRRKVESPFQEINKWKKKSRTGLAVGTFPVYTPWEIIDGCGMFPIGIFGGGSDIEIEYADSLIQSFICSIARSTLEVGLKGKLKDVDAMVFPSICDVSKNLSGIWERNFPNLQVEFIHLPQNMYSESAVDYLVHEYKRLADTLCTMNVSTPKEDSILESISVYNENRAKLRELYEFRSKEPWNLSTLELYIIIRYGTLVPQSVFSETLDKLLKSVSLRDKGERDSVRVILEGSFCEQPPLDMLHLLEEAGCYIVDDDLLVGYRWFMEDVSTEGSPYRNLAEAYINLSYPSSVRHDGNRSRSDHLLEKVEKNAAAGVLFCAAKFCEPALFDYVLLKDALEKNDIPYLSFEFEEKMGVFESIKTQVETFVESILFFS